jgi:hypothetical protein
LAVEAADEPHGRAQQHGAPLEGPDGAGVYDVRNVDGPGHGGGAARECGVVRNAGEIKNDCDGSRCLDVAAVLKDAIPSFQSRQRVAFCHVVNGLHVVSIDRPARTRVIARPAGEAPRRSSRTGLRASVVFMASGTALK